MSVLRRQIDLRENRRSITNRTVSWVLLFLLSVISSISVAEDWPQWRGENRDGVWDASGVIDKFPGKKMAPTWSVEIGAGYSGPTVANGRVFITDRLSEPKQVERVHCYDAKTGKEIWSTTYDCPYIGIGYTAGPRASVTVDGHRAIALGAMGNIHCFEASNGTVLWKRDLNKDYEIEMPIWGIAASPLVVGDLIILHIGGKNGACVVALDKQSGKEAWKALDDRASYSAPILTEQAGHEIVVCWTGDSVSAIDPKKGTVHWRYPFAPKQMPIGIATPILQKDRLFVTSFYDGALMLRLLPDRLAVEKVWYRVGRNEKDTDGLQSIISTPIWIDDHIYGVDSYGQLRCLVSSSGDRVWEDLTATPPGRWSTIHFVRHGDRVWMFNEAGELIIAKLTPKGFDEISRAQIVAPTTKQLNRRGKGVCWSHPAFANQSVFARNDNTLVCVSLKAD